MRRIVLLFILCVAVNFSFGQGRKAGDMFKKSLQWGLSNSQIFQMQQKNKLPYRAFCQPVNKQDDYRRKLPLQQSISVSLPQDLLHPIGKKQIKKLLTERQINRNDHEKALYYIFADLAFSWVVIRNRVQIDSVLIMIKDIEADSVVGIFSKKKGIDNNMVDWNCPSYSFPNVMRAATFLAVLENGGGTDSIVDTREGVYVDIKGDTVRDHNYEHGGYGEMSLQRGLMVNSDIAAVQSVERFLPEGYATLEASLNNMGLRHQGVITNYQTMCQARMNPADMLAWMTNVAKGHVPGISSENVKVLQQALLLHVEEGLGKQTLLLHIEERLGKKAKSSMVKSCGISYTTLTNNPNNYFLSFMGYFPYERPLYSIYIEMYKDGKPATSSFAADVYKKLSEYLMNVIIKNTEQ